LAKSKVRFLKYTFLPQIFVHCLFEKCPILGRYSLAGKYQTGLEVAGKLQAAAVLIITVKSFIAHVPSKRQKENL
jgi:hypothetical protein